MSAFVRGGMGTLAEIDAAQAAAIAAAAIDATAKAAAAQAAAIAAGLGASGYAPVNVTAGRALGVTYTNTTGKALIAFAYVTNATATVNDIEGFVNGVISGFGYIPPVVSAGGGASIVIPPGATYRFSSFGTSTLVAFIELK